MSQRPDPAPSPTPPAPEIACPQCKVIIDMGALMSAAAGLKEAAYAGWESILRGLECGAYRWEDVKDLVYECCEKAEEIEAYKADLQLRIRKLAERPVRG